MDKLFIHAKVKEKPLIDYSIFQKIKGSIGLLTTIQYLHWLPEISENIPGSVIGGQLLGCNITTAKKIDSDVDAFVFIGSGRFHPTAVAKTLKKEVYCYNPRTKVLDQIGKDEIESLEKKEKAGLASFFSASVIGIIVTTKPGQERLALAIELKKKIKDKKTYIFIANDINPNDFENYRIDCLVNTACPRIVEDSYPKPVVNADDIISLYP